MCEHSGSFNVTVGADEAIPLPAAASGQALELAGGDNEWTGGLSDLGIWNTCLTAAAPVNLTVAEGGLSIGTSGGETAALYNTPMSGIAALSQYGVKAMDQLFTLYDQHVTTPAGVTTSNGILGWKYASSGLTAGSGVAGQLSNGQYFVQLDGNGGGVESLLPGDANGDGKVDINDLTVVLAHYGQTGMAWAQGEFTGDGTVDINDLTIVLAHYGQSFGSSSAGGLSAVPEPCAGAAGHGPGRSAGPFGQPSGEEEVATAAHEKVKPVKRNRCLVTWAVLLGSGVFLGGSRAVLRTAVPPSSRPGRQPSATVKPRRDIEGKIVDAHDGCLHKFGDRYYLYGTAYGKTDGFGKTNRYRCYSSPDLVSWKLEGNLLPHQTAGIYYRPYVIYNAKTRKYVLWYIWYQEVLGRAVRRGHQRSSAGTVYGPE